MITLLGLTAVFVWVNAISSSEELDDVIRCEPGPAEQPGTTYTPLPHDALADTAPTPPSHVVVRVLNANGTRGQAALTTEAMRQLGFTQIAPPQNDPAFPAAPANCHGQVRFGENGISAARTVRLIDPCLQLVRDNRQDASVDLSIGTMFNNARPFPAAAEILDRLNAWSAQNAGTGNNEQSVADAGPVIDEELLQQTAPNRC